MNDPEGNDPDLRWVAADELLRLVTEILMSVGLAQPAARQAADVLVEADLRGVESHGVGRMLGVYLEWLAEGHAEARPSVHTVRGRGVVRTIDGDRGLGVATVPPLFDELIVTARTGGMAAATIINSRHLGMASYHAMRALPEGMIGICTTAVGPYIVPTFGREPRLGTNPIAVAAPCASEPHFIFDAAMSATAANKVMRLHRLGLPVGPGVVADESGAPLMTPSTPPEKITDLRLLPIGSTHETGSHKGYGLAAVVEILSSVLGGALPMAMEGHHRANHWLCVIDIEAFSDLAEFVQQMDTYRSYLHATPPAVGQQRVLFPGELEWSTRRQRLAEGIPLTAALAGDLDAMGHRHGVDALEGVTDRPLADLSVTEA